jgi:hypothetical protein
MKPADYLPPIADREPLRWIVNEQRTAFAEHRAAGVARLEPGDRVFLYTTRGCFRNPTRDRGRVIARASVAAPARRLEAPVRFGDRESLHLVELEIETLAPFRQGLELVSLVPRLASMFPDPRSWSVRMRWALVPLAPGDADLIAELLEPVARPYGEARSRREAARGGDVSGLRGRERAAEIGGDHPALREREDDLAVLLQTQARVQDRDSDEAPVRTVARAVSFGRAVEVDRAARIADVQVEDVPGAVVPDVVELDPGDLHPGSDRRGNAVAIHPSSPS